jgi:hypothetical protein
VEDKKKTGKMMKEDKQKEMEKVNGEERKNNEEIR